jgi:hypothetical protein
MHYPKYHEQIGFEPAHHIKDSKNPAVKTPNHVLHHPSEQVRQNNHMVTSEWALPPQFENGIVPEDLLSNKYGHRIHFWDLRARRNVQTIDLGANHQMALEVRPAHDPVREHGFLGVVVDTTNLPPDPEMTEGGYTRRRGRNSG